VPNLARVVTGMGLPPADRGIDVQRIELNPATAPARSLGSDKCCSTAEAALSNDGRVCPRAEIKLWSAPAGYGASMRTAEVLASQLLFGAPAELLRHGHPVRAQ
jgi:hypothetical protein